MEVDEIYAGSTKNSISREIEGLFQLMNNNGFT